MAAIRMTINIILNGVSQSAFRSFSTKRVSLAFLRSSPYTGCRNFSYGNFLCVAASQYGDARKKASARLSQVQQLLVEAEERASSAVNEPPPPKISLEHVTLNFARSGGPGGQNVNKVNTKVGMRFNVKNATWLSERVREKIIQLAIIDAAAYVPPPPTEEQKKKIAQLSAKSEQKRLQGKKELSQKKAFRRSKDSWD